MTSTFTKTVISSVAVALTAFGGAVPAYALALHAGAAASTTVKTETLLSKAIAHSDAAINARITALNALNARVQGMQNVSASAKSTLAQQISVDVNGLNALKAKIDADTDLKTVQADSKSILTTYRIYALVIPQGWILAASDRVKTIASLMTGLTAKLEARITAAQQSGQNVTALTAALADMTTQITTATTAATAANAEVSVLQPDAGNKTTAAANHASLVEARGKVKTATKALQAARKDIDTIVNGLKKFDQNLGKLNLKGGATTTTSTTTH